MTRRRPWGHVREVALVALALLLAGASRAHAQISPGPLSKPHASLEGATNCAQCHGLRREPMNQMCLACHREVQWMIDQKRGLHAREVGDGSAKCATCHPDHAGANFALVAWKEGAPEKFDHNRAGWALEGKHAEAACDKCHTAKFATSPAVALAKRPGGPKWIGLDPDCASCHRADDIHAGSLGKECGSCHVPTGWKPADKFDHARSAYPLTGKHVEVACDKCHLAARLNIQPDAKGVRVPRFKPVPSAQCSSCHGDPHRGRLSPRCADCHNTTGFKDVGRKDFNHALTRYPLLGKHATVSCDQCHGASLANPRPAFATCAGCHADPHNGEATRAGKPADCASCHAVSGFSPSTFTVADHQGAPFRLTGKHQQVKCVSCHVPVAPAAAPQTVPGAPPARGAPPPTSEAIVPLASVHATRVARIRIDHATCASCHSDAHGGQLAARPDKGTCEACHTDAGWKPTSFAASAHAKLRITLEGRHGVIACGACHSTNRPGLAPLTRTERLGTAHVILSGIEVECSGCHVDPHAGRYAAGGAMPADGGCGACHGSAAFRPATMGVAMHARFSFPLEGAHRATPCIACHKEMGGPPAASTLVRAARGVAALPFTAKRATTCESCHESPHGNQFSAREDGGRCEGCHDVNAFAPAARFDHEKVRAFPLAGAHAKVACGSCHKATVVNGKSTVTYRGTPTACESCHGRAKQEGR